MGEPGSLFSFFVSAAAAFGKLTAWLRKAQSEQREATATYFDKIAECLREVAERIEAGKPGRDTCQRLAVYANEIQIILGNHRNLTAAGDRSIDETRERLAAELWQVRDMWMGLEFYDSKGRRIPENEDPIEYAVNILSDDLASAEHSHSHNRAPQPMIENLEHEFIERSAIGSRARVQDIWDAAGEFAALADALRAR